MEDSTKLERAVEAVERLSGSDDFSAVVEMLDERITKLREMNDESEGIQVYRL